MSKALAIPLNPDKIHITQQRKEIEMSNTSGWSLTGRLIAKHFGGLGEKIAQALASFDPETATEADRDQLAARLRDVATKLAQAKTSFAKEQKDVDDLRTRIEKDTLVASKLAERLAAGTVDEATVNLFCDELEAAEARLPLEEQEANDARDFMNELESIVKEISKQLELFDQHAKKAKQELEMARQRMANEQLRTQRNEELRDAANGRGASTALAALQARTAKLNAQTEGMRTVNEVTAAPAKKAAALDALREEVLSGQTGKPTAADRLSRFAKK